MKNYLDKKDITVIGFTESAWNNVTYRANSCYKQNKAWYEWVLVVWTIAAGTSHDVLREPTYSKVIKPCST